MRELKQRLVGFLTCIAVWSAAPAAQAQCVRTEDGSGVQCQTLLAGQTTVAGTVCVQVLGENLEVTYGTTNGWELLETHVWVGNRLVDMPQTRKGSPKIGKFPYHSGDVTGATSYTFMVPLENLRFICDSPDVNYLVAAHASVRKANASGGHDTETGWAEGNRFVERGMWGTYFSTTLTCECGTPCPPVDECMTAWARRVVGENAPPPQDQPATCFLDLDVTGDGVGDFDRWGWTSPFFRANELGRTEIWELWAGASECDVSGGTLVGTVHVRSFTFITDYVAVEYFVNPGYTLLETQTFVGTEVLPRDLNDQFSVCPADFPEIHDMPLTATWDKALFPDKAWGTVYNVAAHAVVCPVQ